MNDKNLLISPQKMKSYWGAQMSKMLKGEDFTSSQVPFIITIGKNEGISMKDVCAALGADKGLTTRVIRTLIEKELVENHGGSTRTYKLYLTKKGKDAYNISTTIMDKVLEQLLNCLDEKDKENLRKITEKIDRRLDELYEY